MDLNLYQTLQCWHLQVPVARDSHGSEGTGWQWEREGIKRMKNRWENKRKGRREGGQVAAS